MMWVKWARVLFFKKKRPIAVCVCLITLYLIYQRTADLWKTSSKRDNLHASTNSYFSHKDSNRGNLTSYDQLKDKKSKSYVLALGYSEQLSAATHSMMQLGTVANDWQANLVEPIVVRSHIFGIRGLYTPFIGAEFGSSALPVFDVYNSTKLNNVLHSGISPNVSMVGFSQFLLNAPKEVTLLHFNVRNRGKIIRLFTAKLTEYETVKSVLAGSDNMSIVDCSVFESFVALSKDIEVRLNALYHEQMKVDKERTFIQTSTIQYEPFTVQKMLCLDPNQVYRSDVLTRFFQLPSTVIFTNWHGCDLTNCSLSLESSLHKKPATLTDSFRFALLTRKHYRRQLFNQYMIHHSSVLHTAKRYLDHLGFDAPFVSVHLRTERIVRYGVAIKNPLYSRKCIDDLIDLLMNITHVDKLVDAVNDILVLADTGSAYGTDSCMGKCNWNMTNLLLDLLQRVGVEIHSYDPKTLNSTENSGFVSLVDMNMLALGRKLILVGFGGFQSNLEHLFLSKGHNLTDVHHICSRPDKEKL